MRSSVVIAVVATVRKLEWLVISIALATLFTLAPVTFISTSASGDVASPTLCSGYQSCALGEFTTHGYENASASSYWEMYPGNNCTNYVAYVESSTYQVPTPTYNLGDGGQWASAATAHGVVVNHTPSVGAVAVWTGGASGMPAAGHVAIVEQVGPHDSYVVISQQHMIGADGYDWVRIMRDDAANQWEDWPSDFVHFTSPAPTFLDAAVGTSNVVLHVTPRRFAGFKFILHGRSDRVVTSGLVNRLLNGTYTVSLRNPALREVFALKVTVSGTRVRVLERGSMLRAALTPRFELTRGASSNRVHVAIAIRRVTSSSNTTSASTSTLDPTTTTFASEGKLAFAIQTP
jgi:surface antigen